MELLVKKEYYFSNVLYEQQWSILKDRQNCGIFINVKLKKVKQNE